MIISHKYKFIFIKTNKTAGTSMEIALSEFCGKDDIITPISPDDEMIRKNLCYPGPQNYLAPLSKYHLDQWIALLFKGKRAKLFYNHIAGKKIKKYIDKDIWNNYFKFCFERNPYERVISLYYWRYKAEPRPTIMEFIDSGIPLVLKRRGFDLYTIDGKVAVDKIYLYEEMDESLRDLKARLGLPRIPVMPKAKSSYRTDKRSYREILTEREKAAVKQMFSKEISMFGYE